ncbi:MAG: hypothetical protein ACOX0G_01420 [Patescibacteria group bacterium]
MVNRLIATIMRRVDAHPHIGLLMPLLWLVCSVVVPGKRREGVFFLGIKRRKICAKTQRNCSTSLC